MLPFPDDLPTRLAARLHSPLPGRKAQRRFAPSLGYGRHHGPPPPDVRHAAVLILLHFDDGWRIPMTLRPHTLPSHAGQVSFPGGMAELGETVEQTALRELEEELGVAQEMIAVLGRLSSLYVWASNFYVTPVLATAAGRPVFVPSPDEVEEVIDVPIEALTDTAYQGVHQIRRRSLTFHAPHIEVAGHRIWGASCMILGEVAALLADCGCGATPERH